MNTLSFIRMYQERIGAVPPSTVSAPVVTSPFDPFTVIGDDSFTSTLFADWKPELTSERLFPWERRKS